MQLGISSGEVIVTSCGRGGQDNDAADARRRSGVRVPPAPEPWKTWMAATSPAVAGMDDFHASWQAQPKDFVQIYAVLSILL